MLIPYWIQKADFTAEDFDAVDFKQAQDVFNKYDWHKEIKIKSDLDKSGSEYCDPGIGFVPGDGRILHICPDGKGKAGVHYHFLEKKKILGLIPHTSNQIVSNIDIKESEIEEIIHYFYLNDHEWLIRKTLQGV